MKDFTLRGNFYFTKYLAHDNFKYYSSKECEMFPGISCCGSVYWSLEQQRESTDSG